MKKLFLFSFLLILIAACQNASEAPSTNDNKGTSMTDKRAPFVHTVFFYLNDEVHDEDKADFEIGLAKLLKVKSISNGRFGKPAMTPREVVDNDYAYALIVEFEDKAAHDAYQDDPIHLEFIEEHEKLWADVKVYDSIMMD